MDRPDYDAQARMIVARQEGTSLFAAILRAADANLDELRERVARLEAAVATTVCRAIVELDAIGCPSLAPCEGPVERAVSLLLPLANPSGDEGWTAAKGAAAKGAAAPPTAQPFPRAPLDDEEREAVILTDRDECSARNRYLCTRPVHHGGDHIAATIAEIAFRWPSSPPSEPAKPAPVPPIPTLEVCAGGDHYRREGGTCARTDCPSKEPAPLTREEAIEATRCPTCDALSGERCRFVDGSGGLRTMPHYARIVAADENRRTSPPDEGRSEAAPVTQTPTVGAPHLWEARHPYYMADGCFYEGGMHMLHASWAAFLDVMGDSDDDLNLVARWDWHAPDPDEDRTNHSLSIYYVAQRKARQFSHEIAVTPDDEPAVRAWLAVKAEKMRAIWSPFFVPPTVAPRVLASVEGTIRSRGNGAGFGTWVTVQVSSFALLPLGADVMIQTLPAKGEE